MSKKDAVCFLTEHLDEAEVQSIKALSRGDATEHQQALALHVIVKKLARTHDLHYIPQSPDQTAFLNGRAFVGHRILKIINQPVQESAGKDTTE